MKISYAIVISLLLLLSSGLALGSQISPESVSPEGVKTYQHKGESATVSHQVPARFFGTYEFAGKGGLIVHYAADGSGYILPAGQSRRNFNWGMLVQDSHLVVTKYTNYSQNNTGEWAAHMVILKWDDGSYYPTYIFELDGRLASPAGNGNMMTKE